MSVVLVIATTTLTIVILKKTVDLLSLSSSFVNVSGTFHNTVFFSKENLTKTVFCRIYPAMVKRKWFNLLSHRVWLIVHLISQKITKTEIEHLRCCNLLMMFMTFILRGDNLGWFPLNIFHRLWLRASFDWLIFHHMTHFLSSLSYDISWLRCCCCDDATPVSFLRAIFEDFFNDFPFLKIN